MELRMRKRSLLAAVLCAAGALQAADAPPPPRAPEAAERVAIGEYVRAHIAPVENCYARRLAINPLLRGKLTVRFDIASDGSVTNESATGMDDQALIDCVLGEIRRWQFPISIPGETLRVAYPLTFKPD